MKRISILVVIFCLLTITTHAQQCWCSFLLDFNTTVQSNGSIRISWRTDTESSLAKDFVIQRSFNASSFSDIGYVSANPGALSQNYSFIDPYLCNPSGTNVY